MQTLNRIKGKIMKTLAPYGDVLLNRDSDYEIVIIFMGTSSFEKAADFKSHFPYTLCLPPQTSPFRYIWPLKNCEVYLVDTDQSTQAFIKSCALCFFSYEALKVNYVSGKRSFILKKGINHD